MNTPKRPRRLALYKNLSKASKVVRYEILKDRVTVRFVDNSVYIYSNQSATPGNIEKMKTLAMAGKGLSTFIDTNLKDKWMTKVR